MSVYFKYEISRFFRKKLNLFLILILIFASFVFIYFGITEYQVLKKDKDSFIEYERNKVAQYVNYDQYGGYGFRVFYEPSPLGLFFYNSGAFDNLFSNVDMKEIIEFSSSHKGEDLFSEKGSIKDFSGIFFILGSLLMLYMAITSYKSEMRFFRFRNIIIRLIILIAIFCSFIALIYIFSKFIVISLSDSPGRNFISFAIYLIVFLIFFYSVAIFIKSFTKTINRAYIYALIFWFISIVIAPQIFSLYLRKQAKVLPANEQYNILNLETVMQFERKSEKILLEKRDSKAEEIMNLKRKLIQVFYETGYQDNIKRENKINKGVEEIISRIERLSFLYPTSFYSFLTKEISSRGYYGYLGFVKYIMGLRSKFVDFYINKKFYSEDEKIESFVKGEENIFKARSHLPKSFLMGAGLHLSYSIILLVLSFFVIKRKSKPKIEKRDIKKELMKGETYTKLFENDDKRNDAFLAYTANENTIGVDRIDADSVPICDGMKVEKMIGYFSYLQEVDKGKALKNLSVLGLIKDLRLRENDTEVIKKIYAAVMMASEGDIIIINDFVKNETRRFEGEFKALMHEMKDQGKTILYLSSEMIETERMKSLYVVEKESTIFKIDLDLVSLR